MRPEIDVGPAEVRLVPDASYGIELKRLIRQSSERIWCSLFIVDTSPEPGPAPPLHVFEALRDLAIARWRGIDARLLLGASTSNRDIAEISLAAMTVARRLGIPTRGLGSIGLRGSHAKLVVADDWVLTGSHNWSSGAFADQIQDSVAVRSEHLAAYMANVFLEQWRRARTAPRSSGVAS